MQQREEALQKGLQTEQIDAELKKAGMQIASQELMAAAQLLQQDNQWREEFLQSRNISNEELAIKQQQLQLDIENSLASRTAQGIQNEALKASLQNDKVRNAMELAAFGMEMGNGSPEAMAPFVAQLGTALEAAFKEQGVDIRAEDFAKAFMPTDAGTGTTGSAGANVVPGSVDAIQNAKDSVMDIMGTLPANIDRDRLDSLVSGFASAKVGTTISDSVYSSLKSLPGASANLTAPVSTAASATDRSRTNTGATTTTKPTAKTQAGADYTQFAQLVSLGLTEKQAFDVATQAIGKERMAAAYKALTGKDWTA
jgi:hypothetical protein